MKYTLAALISAGIAAAAVALAGAPIYNVVGFGLVAYLVSINTAHGLRKHGV